MTPEHLQFCGRLLLAAILGAAIGLERELAGKPAGLRTNILIAVGAALFTQVSLALPAAAGVGDPGRIAAQVVAGVGFLGAGTILHSRHVVHGLTSAATVWVVAGIGVTVGLGDPHGAVLAVVLMLVALFALGRIERRLLGQDTLTLTLAFTERAPEPEALLRSIGSRRKLLRMERKAAGRGGVVRFSWRGAAADAPRAAEAAQAVPGVRVEGWEVES